jgi:hypothetical protein
VKHEHGLQGAYGQAAAETQTNGVQMKTKGQRQSKNVSDYRDDPSVAQDYTSFKHETDLKAAEKRHRKNVPGSTAQGKRMGMDPIHKAIESGKFGANSAMPHKTGRNPFAKARSK